MHSSPCISSGGFTLALGQKSCSLCRCRRQMISPSRKPISGEEPPAFSMSVLPKELISEILSRFPGKQIVRCKCVCKPWRSIIRSRAFSKAYRKRQSGMLLCWPKEIKMEQDPRLVAHRLRFFHCPLRRSEEPLEEFSLQSEMEIRSDGEPLFLNGVSQLVNGLLCVGEDELWGSNFRLTLHNVCTGEKMRLLDPPDIRGSSSTYYLGYDPVRRIYKLLRLIFHFSDESLQGAQIINLGPPSDLCFCREGLLEERTSPDDGMLCWRQMSLTQGLQDLMCFDVSRESFRVIEHPVAGSGFLMVCFDQLTHAITRFGDSLVIWFSVSRDDFSGISCFVQEDDKGKNWSMKRTEFSKAFEERGGFVVELENHHSFSSTAELLVRNPDQSWRVYPYSHLHAQQIDKEDVLFVGKLPDGAPSLYYTSKFRYWDKLDPGPLSSVFSFPESNNLYQSLEDVLGVTSATM